jgi:ubiquinone/menaquinone biosynthesis C-methylase UbiE
VNVNKFTRFDYTEGHIRSYVSNYQSGRRKYKIKVISRFLNDIRGESVLDIGIGSGFFTRLCIQKGARVFSTDFADPIIEYHGHENPDFRLIQGNAEELPFRDSSFDLILALDVLEHLHMPLVFLRELNRVLKSGGRIILSTPNTRGHLQRVIKRLLKPLANKIISRPRKDIHHACTHVREYSARELNPWFEKSGFKIEFLDTYTENILYLLLNPILSVILSDSLRAYTWCNLYYVLIKQDACV